MKKTIIRRKIADDTRAKIIKAARKLFAAGGFSATSTQAIASKAKVNETLIFHHFGNKEKLWQIVKADVIDSINITALDPKPNSLRTFLQTIFTQRVNAYEQQPELIRLLQWQRLEPKQKDLAAGNLLAPNNWLPALEHLQKTGKVTADIAAEIIMIWLMSSINAMILDNLGYLKDQKSRQLYLETLINGFEKALQP